MYIIDYVSTLLPKPHGIMFAQFCCGISPLIVETGRRLRLRPALMAHSYRLYQVRIPVGPDICHCGCAYAVLQVVQRHGVYSITI